MRDRSKQSEREKLWKQFELLFLERRWDKVRPSWVPIIPILESPGQPPNITLSSIIEVFYPDGPTSNGLFFETLPRGEIPEVIFREAVYWLHKAIHVLGASEKHIEAGLPTWSLSAGYQCGFFAARSILAFHGIAIGEHDRSSFVVDLCRDSRGVSGTKLDQIGAFEDEASFRTLGYLFGHKEIWLLFQRLLRVAKRNPWPDDYDVYYREVDMIDLSEQRHSLHYKIDYWVMEDLCETVFSEEFSKITPSGKGKKFIDARSCNFSVSSGLAITQMAMHLFESLCELTNRLEAERELFTKILSSERHPFFGTALKVRPTAA